ncbi:MAG: SCO family protein [Amaricoccus sp.]
MRRAIALAATAALLVMLGVTGYLAWGPRSDDPFADCRKGQVATGAAAIGGPFSLIDSSGARVSDADVITRPSLVYFGYTFCPDICPTDLSRNALAAEILAGKGIAIGQVFISIDPARDTPEVVRDFTGAIHPELVGLTGSDSEVAAAAKAYRVYYRKASGDPENYMMDHSTFTYLMAPGVGFLDFYGSDVSPEVMAGSVACFARKLGRVGG